MNAAKKNIKTLVSLLVVATLLLLIIPKPAYALSLFSFADLAYTVIGKIIFGISYIISFVLGVVVAVEAWLIQIILNINTNITNSTPVKFGFPVVLSIANLGFVLGIIVIAIATILRRETYGIKQILWKLIVMAILVNFSLVIASAILSFADNLTMYFLEGVNPAGSVAGANNGISSINNFSSALAGAFNPQKGFLGFNKLSDVKSEEDIKGFEGAFAATGSDLGKLLAPITSLLFVVFALIMIIITLGALVVMLIIRYVTLGILLILAPVAWMCWVFPALKSNWDKWWHSFLRWTFFAPVVVFFLWLGIQTSYEMNKGATGTYDFSVYKSTSNVVWASVSNLFTNIFSPVVENLMQMTILVGIMVGGLFAANALGIAFAKTAYGAAQGVGKGFSGYVARKGGGVFARAATQPPPPAGASTWSKTKYALKSPLRWGARVLPPTGRAAIQNWGTWAATSPGWAASIWNGMRTGHGTYGPKRKAQWTCQSCIPLGYPSPTVITQPNRPTNDFTCTQCGQSTNGRRAALGNPTYQNWA
jgi:hypothetical protein